MTVVNEHQDARVHLHVAQEGTSWALHFKTEPAGVATTNGGWDQAPHPRVMPAHSVIEPQMPCALGRGGHCIS